MSTLPWPESPRLDMAIYPDDYIEYWADRYVERGYFYRGVTLMQFLACPLRYEHDGCYVDPLPLLGRQLRVQARLIAAEHHARRAQQQRDGDPIDLSWVTLR